MLLPKPLKKVVGPTKLSFSSLLFILAAVFCIIFGTAGCAQKTINDTDIQPPQAREKAFLFNDIDMQSKLLEARYRKADDGLILIRGNLYAVDKDGNILKNCDVGILHFGGDGKYTSGSEELDRYTRQIVWELAGNKKDRFEILRAAYKYTVDNIEYVGFVNHSNSYVSAYDENEGWAVPCAIDALSVGKGNCYYFTAAFAALARQLGFQAYAVGGTMGSLSQPHSWVIIVDGDQTYMCDPETEYAKYHNEKKTVDLFYKTPDTIGERTGISYNSWIHPWETINTEERKAS